MPINGTDFARFAAHRHPFDLLEMARLEALADHTHYRTFAKGETILAVGDKVPGLFLIQSGSVDLITPQNTLLLHLHIGNCFGERAMLSEGSAPNKAVANEDTAIFLIAADAFAGLIADYPAFHAFFDSSLARKSARPQVADAITDLISIPIGELMTPSPVTIAPDRTVGKRPAPWPRRISPASSSPGTKSSSASSPPVTSPIGLSPAATPMRRPSRC